MRAHIAVTAAAFILSAGLASAEPGSSSGFVNPFNPNVSASEREAIRRSKLRLRALQQQAGADGRVTAAEKARIRQARTEVRRMTVNARRD